MPTVQTPATMVAAANELTPLVGMLNASGDATKQARALVLGQKISDALTAASNLAAQDVIDLLDGQDVPLQQLRALDMQARAAAAAIATDEAKVEKAITFASSAVSFAVAVVSSNLPAAASGLSSMLASLSIVA